MSPHQSMQTLEAGLGEILATPKDNGRLVLITRRPETEQREVLEQGELTTELGLVGDNWKARGSKRGDPEVDRQLTLMNWRAISLISPDEDRRILAGDQLYVDFDISADNTPPGTQLAVGEAVVEITDPPHTGCKKFTKRFGLDAMKFVNDERGRQLNLRGVNARVITPGIIRSGDAVSKVVS